jgi:membrane-associated phospholipid phosphatase
MSPRDWLTKPLPVMRFAWSRREWLGGRWFYIEIFVWGFLGVAGIYFLINHLIANFGSYGWSPELAIDRKIPAVAWMIIPYTSLYLLTPGAIFLHPLHDRGRMELLLALQGLVVLSAIHAIFFILFPADIALRDQLPVDILAYEGFLGGMYEFIHTVDNPTNAWPSLHITLSYIICRVMTIWLDRDYAETTWGKPLKWILWANWVLICVSILTTKQHYIFDLATGLIFAFGWWWLIEPGFANLDATADDEIDAIFDNGQ